MSDQLPLFEVSFSVTDLTRYLRQLLESDPLLRSVWVKGEVSNLALPASGHVYFTLKDAGAALKCVIWRATMQRLRIDLQNGAAVEVHGQVSLYEVSGQYQLYVDAIRMAGEGRLYQEFLMLKNRLEAEGLFAEERKRALPDRPRRVGVITSATGAALQDILNTLGKRCPLVEVVLAPSSVQGVEAPAEIVRALKALNALGGVDVILLARGGGSLEDLWAFNDERVVRAIAGSTIPVVSGVGHETDFTLADFAADVRAPTPTGAAVRAVPDLADLRTELGSLSTRLSVLAQNEIESQRDRLAALAMKLERLSPAWRMRSERQRIDELQGRLGRAAVANASLLRARLAALTAHLTGLNPLALLERGYTLIRSADGEPVRSVKQLSAGQLVALCLADGQADAKILTVH